MINRKDKKIITSGDVYNIAHLGHMNNAILFISARALVKRKYYRHHDKKVQSEPHGQILWGHNERSKIC